MPYNREWDQGKEWNNQDWNAQDDGYGYARNHRADDDQYQAGGKRRKYNNGGYDESHYTSYEGGSAGYTAAAHQDASYDAYDDRQRGPPRKRHVASEPSPHVIFLGLDTDFTEADLFEFLREKGCLLETCTIIRDRNTGQSKGFGFAQFKTVEHARAFVEPNFPFVSVPPPASHGASATAAFKKALLTGGQHNGRRVKIDYSQSAGGAAGRAKGPQFSNDGTRDIGNTQASVLLFRTLDPLVGPAAIAQAMKASSGPGKEGAKGMKRVVVIKDRVTMASWGFAFVEFVDVAAASAALAATMSPQLHPNGFRISDRPAAVSFAHPYSFQPLPDHAIPDETCIPSSASFGGVEGGWVKYWDEASTIATMEFKVDEPVQPATEALDKKKEKKKTKAAVEQHDAVPEASALPVSTKPVALNFSKNIAGSIKVAAIQPARPIAKSSLGFATIDDPNAPNNEDESGNQVITADESKSKAAYKPAPLIASKKVVNNITKWNQVQEVLHHNEPEAEKPAAPTTSRSATPPVSNPRTDAPNSEFEFSDIKAMTCLLCSRQFKSLDILKRHNLESDLHKKNLKDTKLRDVAREKAEAARSKAKGSAEPTQKYRDRASERRNLHNQPEAPMLEPSSVKQPNKRFAEVSVPAPPPAPPVAPAKDESNVGNKLLKMMGWKEGTGLGTEGEGRVDPIETAVYSIGAGLGASKGKDIGKYAEAAGSGSYMDMAKLAARERFAEAHST